MLKKIVLILLSLIVLVVGGGLGYFYLRQPAQAAPSAIKVSMAPERIARGKVLFEHLADCDGCHSERDFTRVAGPVVPSGRGKGSIFSDTVIGLPGFVVVPNITPDVETGIGSWTDGEKIRAIREGVSKDGRALFPMMPYQGFRNMSDEDVESLVAYLNSLPPVKNPLPKTKLSFPLNLIIKGDPQPIAGPVPPPNRADKLQYGEYLVKVAGCGGCHSQAERGAPVPGKEFAGGELFDTTIGKVVSANITPDVETGLGKWSEAFFLKKFYDYKEYAVSGPPKAVGPQAFTVMPWLAFSQLPPEDLAAIYTYLRTLKPINNPVETHPGYPNAPSGAN